MSQILLFGGSFDPPHLGHLIVIHQSLELLPHINELWLLPTYHHTFDKKSNDPIHRLNMCKQLVADMAHIKVCPIEIDTKSNGSTYQTLQNLKTKYPEHTFSFLVGSDQLPHFPKWHQWQQLLQEMHFFVYPRGSHRHEITFPNMTLLESTTQIITNISSSLIRDRLQHRLPVDLILPDNIAQYMKLNQLMK